MGTSADGLSESGVNRTDNAQRVSRLNASQVNLRGLIHDLAVVLPGHCENDGLITRPFSQFVGKADAA